MWRKIAFLMMVGIGIMTGAVWSQAADQDGAEQVVRPLVDPPCQAAYTFASYPAMGQTWITNGQSTNGHTTWWKFDWTNWINWYICSNYTINACKECVYQEVTFWSTANSQWVLASGGLITLGGVGVANSFLTASCNTSNSATHTTTYGYPYPAGRSMKITWYYADYDPNLGPDCLNQNFMNGSDATWTIPPDGP